MLKTGKYIKGEFYRWVWYQLVDSVENAYLIYLNLMSAIWGPALYVMGDDLGATNPHSHNVEFLPHERKRPVLVMLK